MFQIIPFKLKKKLGRICKYYFALIPFICYNLTKLSHIEKFGPKIRQFEELGDRRVEEIISIYIFSILIKKVNS